MGEGGNRAAWASLVTGIASVAVIPVAVYVTRYTASYELLDSAFAIPVAFVLGLTAMTLARRGQRRSSLSLVRPAHEGVVKAGRILGIAGVCIASAALVSLAVYGLLEYVGTRD
jgi:hypothetical protein